MCLFAKALPRGAMATTAKGTPKRTTTTRSDKAKIARELVINTGACVCVRIYAVCERQSRERHDDRLAAKPLDRGTLPYRKSLHSPIGSSYNNLWVVITLPSFFLMTLVRSSGSEATALKPSPRAPTVLNPAPPERTPPHNYHRPRLTMAA